MTYRTRKTVVGYDGSRGAQAALDWAAVDAARRGSELLILHVVQWKPAESASRIPELEDAGRQHLLDALTRVRQSAPDLPVTLEMSLSGVARTLVEASHAAELIVLGAATGGTNCSAVLSRAGCPVVVVEPAAAHVA